MCTEEMFPETDFLKDNPQVVGSGGGVLAGGLTVAGGVMTVMTAGAALPVLVAVRPRILNRKAHAFRIFFSKNL